MAMPSTLSTKEEGKMIQANVIAMLVDAAARKIAEQVIDEVTGSSEMK